MSEHSIIVVRLDAPPSEVDAIAESLRAWLVSEGVTTPEGKPLPGWFRVAPDDGRGLPGDVDIVTDWQIQHPGENFTPPSCPSCGAARDEDIAYVDEWYDTHVEPEIACAACGWSALDGDWPGEFWLAGGAPAVVFDSWPPLDPAFTDEVRRRLGGRTRVIVQHT